MTALMVPVVLVFLFVFIIVVGTVGQFVSDMFTTAWRAHKQLEKERRNKGWS